VNRSHGDADAKYCRGQNIGVTVMLTFASGMLFRVILSVTGILPSVCVKLLTMMSMASHISTCQTVLNIHPNGRHAIAPVVKAYVPASQGSH